MKKMLQSIFTLLLLLLCFSVNGQQVFRNKIQIPPAYNTAGNNLVEIKMSQKLHLFDPNGVSDSLNGTANGGIQAWCYNINIPGADTLTYLGPTLIWNTGDSVKVNVINQLNQPSTNHWHGAEVPAIMDGGPHDPITAGGGMKPLRIVNIDEPSTLWYHPHYHNTTFEQVSMGLSGMIVSKKASDPIASLLPGTYRIDDIPLVLSDIALKKNSTTYQIDTGQVKRPVPLVNGVTNAYYEVPNSIVRFRVLNGSTRKGINIGFAADNDTTTNNLIDFTIIATDGGYAINPNTRQQLLTGPGERYEILLDLSTYAPGQVVYLRNMKWQIPNYVVGSPYAPPAGLGGGKDSTAGNSYLELRIVDRNNIAGFTPVTSFSGFTTTWDPNIADEFNVDTVRIKDLVKKAGGGGFEIDNTTFHMDTINDTVCLGAKEIWEINNVSGISHPFHIHKLFFRVLDITNNSTGFALNLDSMGIVGPKDDVLVPANTTMRFVAKFDDFPSPLDAMYSYMYHCHILTHEDAIGGGMMHQFVVTDQDKCGSGNINEKYKDPMFVFPNPGNGHVFLTGHAMNPSQIKVYNTHGQLVIDRDLPVFMGQYKLDFSSLQAGIYHVQWDSPHGLLIQKLVIE